LKFFSRNKELSDPAIIVSSCIRFLLNRITDDLEREGYSWNKPWGVKRYESMLLAKFILDYSFEKIVEGQLSDDEKIGYYKLSNTLFSSMFNEEFSEVGINFTDMKEEIEKKVEGYFTSLKNIQQPPECYYKVYMLITGSQSREELNEEVKKKTAGLDLIRTNKIFASIVTQYEGQIKHLTEQVAAFDQAEIMLPHMLRSARQKIKNMNINKITNLSKKLAKKDKKK